MKKNLEDYVLHFKNLIPKNICEDVVKELDSVVWQEHSFYYHKDQEYNKETNKEFLYSTDPIPSNTQIMNFVWNAIKQYIEYFNFPWHAGWNGHSNLKFNKYIEGSSMKEHCDHIHDLFEGDRRGIPVLSVVGSLNEDYLGGEFIMFEDKEYIIKKGEAIIFPSNFLYPHKVNLITKGNRFTYVSWVY